MCSCYGLYGKQHGQLVDQYFFFTNSLHAFLCDTMNGKIYIDCHPIYEFIECAAQVQIHTYPP